MYSVASLGIGGTALQHQFLTETLICNQEALQDEGRAGVLVSLIKVTFLAILAFIKMRSGRVGPVIVLIGTCDHGYTKSGPLSDLNPKRATLIRVLAAYARATVTKLY